MTTIAWERRGLVFEPDGSRWWGLTHASLPVTLPLGPGSARVFFAGRDEHNRSHIGFVDIEAGPAGVEVIAGPPPEPSLAPGPLGCFDDHGVYPASLVRADDGSLLLYYIGWNPGVPAPLFYSSIGLAISEDDGRTFRRHSAAPLLARGVHDPCLLTSPCVLREGERWRMWYVSGFRWEQHGDTLHSYYHVKYAESRDGLDWQRDGHVCIELAEGERNIARPCVVREGDDYRMWYSFNRGDGYRIGCARSSDGLDWERQDDRVELGAASGGWDSEAQAYPWVSPIGDDQLMLYNGNGYGRDGFGAAIGGRRND